jgi:microcystin-dependent protein
MGSPVKPSDLDAAVPSVFSNSCSSFKSLFLLGPLLKTWWHYVYDSNGDPTEEFLASIASIGVPTGSLIDWPIGVSIPKSYLVANGQIVSQAAYPSLFAVYGNTFGGSGTTFGLPDLTDRYRVGASPTRAAGTKAGNPNSEVTLEVTNLAAHTHRSIATAQGDNAYNSIWGSSPDSSKTGALYGDNGLVNIATEENPIATSLEATGEGAGFNIEPMNFVTIVLVKT